MSTYVYTPRPNGPQLNDWVWVTGYIDMTPKQRELCRVRKGDFPHQLVLKGHWRGKRWAYTEVELDLHPPRQPGRRKADFRFTKLPDGSWQAASLGGRLQT